MAEAILSDAVCRILEVLGSLVFRETQLAYGVRDEIRKLKDTVETINGVVLDAEDPFHKKSQEATAWLQRLKDAVYDADDLLDDFNTELKWREMMTEKAVRTFFSKSKKAVYDLKMGHKIKTIRKRLDEIKNDSQFLLFKHLDERGVNNREREQLSSFVHEDMIVGRDDDKNAIIQLLLDSNDVENVSVLPIVGIGGVGKTTVVQSVYNANNVIKSFWLRIWVSVSNDFDLKKIIRKIIKSITHVEPESLEMDQLQERLRQQIVRRKYLIVLEDVWNENPDRWCTLKDLLMNGAKGSKILVTTRSEKVAKITSKLPFYVLGGLSGDKSWSLFMHTAFEQGKEPKDSRLVAIGKEIVSKCGGIPLAIKTIGRLLHYNNIQEDDWLSFRGNLNQLSEIDGEADLLPILKLSYDYLPSQLKQCFAYCALFPKNYEIEKGNLIRLWMAQGFLETSNKNQLLEDIGDKYFMNLLSRSFFQDLKHGIRGKVTCKMHDLMHDLAQSVVGSECAMVTVNANNVGERTCHVSFDPDLYSLEISTALLKANRLRTFFPLRSYIKLNQIYRKRILTSFRCLHTLKLSGSGIIEVPSSVIKLKHLRYLDLSWNHFKDLPDSMSKLINLQTLDLTHCVKLVKLPRDIGKMVSLHYLLTERCDSLTMPFDQLGQLTNLQTLSYFQVGHLDTESDLLWQLHELNNLQGSLVIRIFGRKKNVNFAKANLEGKQYLESLKLSGWDAYDGNDGMRLESLKLHPNLKELTVEGFGSVIFSGHMSSLTNLTKIEITNMRRCRTIMPFDQLPSLHWLHLYSLGGLEYISNSSSISTATCFPSLKKLSISCCYKLKGWWKINKDNEMAELPSFPCLSELHIRDCPELICMPLYPTVEELKLENTSSKPLQQTVMTKKNIAAPSTSSTSPALLSDLKSLTLVKINDLESLPELLRNVTCLVYLCISACSRSVSQLSQCIQHLSSLEKLVIQYCHMELLDKEDDKHCQWQGLISLRYLELFHVNKLVSLPRGIQHIATLQHLKIYCCPNLMCLPEGLQVKKLEIGDCPLLLERYRKWVGVDWPKIAHIPKIELEDIDFSFSF